MRCFALPVRINIVSTINAIPVAKPAVSENIDDNMFTINANTIINLNMRITTRGTLYAAGISPMRFDVGNANAIRNGDIASNVTPAPTY